MMQGGTNTQPRTARGTWYAGAAAVVSGCPPARSGFLLQFRRLLTQANNGASSSPVFRSCPLASTWRHGLSCWLRWLLSALFCNYLLVLLQQPLPVGWTIIMHEACQWKARIFPEVPSLDTLAVLLVKGLLVACLLFGAFQECATSSAR